MSNLPPPTPGSEMPEPGEEYTFEDFLKSVDAVEVEAEALVIEAEADGQAAPESTGTMEDEHQLGVGMHMSVTEARQFIAVARHALEHHDQASTGMLIGVGLHIAEAFAELVSSYEADVRSGKIKDDTKKDKKKGKKKK